MKKVRIVHPDNRVTRINEWGDVEFVNPTEHIKSIFMDILTSIHEELLYAENLDHLVPLANRILYMADEKEWEKKYRQFKEAKLPENLQDLLNTNSKAEQIKILKGLTLDTDTMYSFFMHAGEKGYLYSSYKSEHLPKGFEDAKMPTLFRKHDDDSITITGDTDLTKGQLKQLLDQRKILLARFLDLGEKWHCFFWTYKSIFGEENYKDGQAHIHYISNYWTIPREIVKSELKKKNHDFTSEVHIAFNGSKT